LGAELVINYRRQDFAAEVANWTPEGVHLVLDIVGRDYLERNLAALAPRGRLVCIATMSGAKVELDISVVMRKRISIIGSVLRSRSIAEKSSLVEGFAAKFLPLFDTGGMVPVVDSVFRFDQVEKAHERMQQSSHIGKIVLAW
jgi:NADPH:quinone reductase-like Zn-dependent oxidoreductase